jgi:putative redox protein
MTAKSESQNFTTRIAGYDIIVDTTRSKGGTGSCIRPHELLEAAVAACLNISLRMVAQKNNICLNEVETRVELNRSDPEKTIFEYSVVCKTGSKEEEQASILLRKALQECPVRKTLSKELVFKEKQIEIVR